MVIHLDAKLEAALNEQASLQGIVPEELAIYVLRDGLLASAPPEPRDEWERGPGEFSLRQRIEQRGTLRLMAHLLDTSILVRLANVTDVQHSVAAWAVLELHHHAPLSDLAAAPCIRRLSESA